MDGLYELAVKNIIFSVILFIFGYWFAKKLGYAVERKSLKRFSKHHAALIRRLIFYVSFLGFAFCALQQLGFHLGVLIGAAGVLSVALGFASKTAASNFISGVFLIIERPFSIGDTIAVKGITGTVETIDLLSTKIRTPDALSVRVPNETMIGSEITNLSFYPTRRIEFLIGVGYDVDIARAKHVFLDCAHQHEKVLEEPAPDVRIHALADSAIELKCMAWVAREDFGAVKSALQEQLKTAYDREKIAIPYPQLAVHQAS